MRKYINIPTSAAIGYVDAILSEVRHHGKDSLFMLVRDMATTLAYNRTVLEVIGEDEQAYQFDTPNGMIRIAKEYCRTPTKRKVGM